MSAENVIRKIEEKASAEAEEILEQGRKKASKAENDILEDAKRRASDILTEAKKNADGLLRGIKQQEELNVRIDEINEKRRILEKQKEAAEQELGKSDRKSWMKLYTRLICENAAPGTVYVQVSSEEAGKYSGNGFCREAVGEAISILDYWSAAASEKCGEKVTFLLDKNFAKISGGVILCGENYDVDLSVEALLKEVFEENEKKIADCLFDTGAV